MGREADLVVFPFGGRRLKIEVCTDGIGSIRIALVTIHKPTFARGVGDVAGVVACSDEFQALDGKCLDLRVAAYAQRFRSPRWSATGSYASSQNRSW